LPGVVDLADLDFVPTTKRLLLGLGDNGQPLTVPASALMHTGIVGNTGGGKSNTGRLLLAQLLSCNVPCVLADPHFTELDAESGEDWRPIARRLKLAPARKPADIQDLFVWLDGEMRRRYDLREAGEKWGAPLVCYVDELPAIIANVPGAMDTLAQLLQEGRKVFLYVVTSSQSLLTDVLKTPGEVRDNLRSCYYSGGAADSVVRLLDLPKRDIFTYEEQLGQGVVLLRSAATPRATLARVPLASNQGIARLLPDDLHQQAETIDMAIPRQGTGNGSAKAYSAAEQRILDMFAGGASIAEIAREISGAKNGRRYTEASEQAQAVLRQAMQRPQARAVGE
jgi:DNA segregation ATPase FtsK/SpoIIIE-like protein